MRHMDLFSGIGGMSLAVRWLGGETVGFCEIDPWCRKVLAKHWPGVPMHDDVTTLRGDEFGPVDLVTGGYPCQPFSVAGKRRGAEDDRHLWPHMRRVIDTARPRFVLAENVAGHISLGLDVVLSDLEADGYTCGAVVVPAGAVNALHRRDRVWIMAHAEKQRHEWSGNTRSRRTGSANSGGPLADAAARGLRRGRPPGHAGQPPRGGEATDAGRLLDDALRRRHGTPEEQICAGRDGAVGPGGRQAPRQVDPQIDGISRGLVRRPAAGPAWQPDVIRQAWADGSWERDLPRVVADEPERRQKLQAAGNAICPPVAYEILRVMLGGAA